MHKKTIFNFLLIKCYNIMMYSIKTLFWCAATLCVVFSLMTGLSLFLEGVKGDESQNHTP